MSKPEWRPTFAIAIVAFSRDGLKYRHGLYVNHAESQEAALGMAMGQFTNDNPGHFIASYLVEDLLNGSPLPSPEESISVAPDTSDEPPLETAKAGATGNKPGIERSAVKGDQGWNSRFSTRTTKRWINCLLFMASTMAEAPVSCMLN